MERFAYFTLRIRIDDSEELAGVLERLGTGERRDFHSADILREQLIELSSEPNMPRVTTSDKEAAADPPRPGGREQHPSQTGRNG